jgi:hypothetical protein
LLLSKLCKKTFHWMSFLMDRRMFNLKLQRDSYRWRRYWLDYIECKRLKWCSWHRNWKFYSKFALLSKHILHWLMKFHLGILLCRYCSSSSHSHKYQDSRHRSPRLRYKYRRGILQLRSIYCYFLSNWSHEWWSRRQIHYIWR